MTDAQIKHMVDRFLGWRLPEDFSPDAGISFKPTFNDHMPQPMKHNPIGTNLFDARQAEEMVRYMIEGLPAHKVTISQGDLATKSEDWLAGFDAGTSAVCSE